MSSKMRFARAVLATAALALSGCTSLLGDFSYDPNGGGGSGGSGGEVMQGNIVIMPTTDLVTTESGTKANFTIVLAKEPMAGVAIALNSSNTKEGMVNPSVVLFTQENWKAPQMVQVTGVDDSAEDGPVEYTILTSPATSVDKVFNTIDPIDPKVVNIDNDTAGVTLMPPSGLTTTEAGGEATFSVVLNHVPTADVVIPLMTDKPTEGSVSPAMLTFTPDNWMAPQFVTVAGVDDMDKDGDQTFTVVTGNAMSADAKYQGLEVADEIVTNKDNESAGVVVEPTVGLLTSEKGLMTSFSVALSSAPTGDVILGLESPDNTEGTVSPTTLTFTADNWMAPQVVSVTGVDDTISDGNQPYPIVIRVMSAVDADYQTLEPPNVEVINVDDDSAGITLTPTVGLMTGENLSGTTFSAVLNSRPAGPVTLDVSSSRPEEGTVTPATLTFTTANWDAPQVVTVTGVDDKVADGSQLYVVHVKPNADQTEDDAYDAILEQDVALTNVDNDSAGFSVKPVTGLVTTESGGTATFAIALNSEPKADVRVGLSSSNTAEGTVGTALLTFTPANWASEQMVTVRGVNDNMADGNQPYRIITANGDSDDPGYKGRDVPNIEVTNTDNDTAGITVTPTNQTLTTTEGGGSASFTVVLNSEPKAPVSFTVTSSDTSEGTVSTGMLTFTPMNWNAPQTVTVKGVDDGDYDGAQQYQVTFGTIMAAGDPNYPGDRLKPLDVKFRNVDDDTASIQVTNAGMLQTSEKNNGSATFFVALGSRPKADVSIVLTSSRPSEGTVSATPLKFTAVNWKSPQPVLITGAQDSVQDGPQTYFILFTPASSGDKDYQGLVPPTGNPKVTNIDDDSAGIHVTIPPPTSALPAGVQIATSEPAVTAMFSIELTSQPTADVTISLVSNKPGEGTVTPASITFTPMSWSGVKTITLTGVDESTQDGDQPYSIAIGPAQSEDPKYKGMMVADVKAINRDNDTAKILVSPVTGNTKERSPMVAKFTVSLQTKPTAPVTIPVASKTPTEGVTNLSTITLNDMNWAAGVEVEVTGQDEKFADGPQDFIVELGVSKSADPNYNNKDPDDVMVTNLDDDQAGFTVSKISGDTSESGGKPGTASFSIVLNTIPTGDVTVSFKSSNTKEGVLDHGSHVFTAANWNSADTVFVTGVDDDGTADGKQGYSVTFDLTASGDMNYDKKQLPPVDVFNTDNDSAGITVSGIQQNSSLAPSITSEDGITKVTFHVTLNSRPHGNIQIPIVSKDTTEGNVSTTMLTFTPGGWQGVQDVTVTGADDDEADGNPNYSVQIGAPIITDVADSDYVMLSPIIGYLRNNDNDSAGFVVEPTGTTSAQYPSGFTAEDGTTTKFLVRLNSKPSSSVTIPLMSSDSTEGALSASQVVLTAVNWKTGVEVTISGQDDAEADGAQEYSILTGASTSMDANYSGKTVPDLEHVWNLDNDTAAFNIIILNNNTHTSEMGGKVQVNVTLKTKPTAAVSLPVSSSDTGEGMPNVSKLDFTPTDYADDHIVELTGVSDGDEDGSVGYSLMFGKASGAGEYKALPAPTSITLTNDDNPAVKIDMTGGVATHEVDTKPSVTFTVVLTAPPTSAVTVVVAVSDDTEAEIVDGASLSFTTSDWDRPQEVSVQGLDDMDVDGDMPFSISFGPPQSSDSRYSNLEQRTVMLSNVDDEM